MGPTYAPAGKEVAMGKNEDSPDSFGILWLNSKV